EAQSRFNVPELDFWVTNLCLRIEGAGQNDRLKFVYTHVDERDWEREAWFELSTASRDYEVKHCRPKLEREKIDRVLERVNESRELPALLKGMRELKAAGDSNASNAHHRNQPTRPPAINDLNEPEHAQTQAKLIIMPPPGDSEKQDAARQAVDILHEISTILVRTYLSYPPATESAADGPNTNCHLDRRTLSVCISMVENGVNPEALANVVQYLRKEAQKVNFANAAAAGNQ
ncbi:hypothetical protein CHU98_g4393, partial [Xylaria longipes]